MHPRRRITRIPIVVLLACLSSAGPAFAQSAEGPIVSGTIGSTAIESETALSFSVAAGYRFNSAFGLGVEFVSAPSIDADEDLLLPVGRPVDFRDVEGELTVFTANVRLEIPTTSSRFVPYAIAGGGVANLKRSIGAIILAFDRLRPPTAIFPSSSPLQPSTIFPPPSCCSYRLSTTSLALTLGGGVSVLVGDHLSIDVDLRYLRLLDTVDQNIGRFGAGASYRF
jgi:opacity protein-like surface antigen